MSVEASQSERLALAFPNAIRMHASFWEAARSWGFYVFDENTRQLAGAMAPTLSMAIEACIAQAPTTEDLF